MIRKSPSAVATIARIERHGLGQGEIKELGLHTSQHFTGAMPKRNPVQRLGPKDDGMAPRAQTAGTRFIGGR